MATRPLSSSCSSDDIEDGNDDVNNNDDYDDDANVDCNANQVSPLGQDAVQLKVEDETESHAWFVQLYDDYVIQYDQSLHGAFFGMVWLQGFHISW